MSTAFQERRIRRSDIWFGVTFLSAFAVLLAVEIMIQLNTRDEMFKYLRRVESIATVRGFAASDPEMAHLLEAQGKELDALLNLSEQKARIAYSMKQRLDSHAKRISQLEHMQQKLLKAEQKERAKLPPKEKEIPRPKLGPRK